MFELYNKVWENNDNTRLDFDIYDDGDKFVVDFVQSERGDLNKWSQPQVLTDVTIIRFFLPEICRELISREILISYIKDNFDENCEVIKKIEEMSKSKHNIKISLPTSRYSLRRGMPTTKSMRDTCFPLIVKVDGKDVSSSFIDFGDFEHLAVDTAYKALIKGITPKHKNDIFDIKGVQALHRQINDDQNAMMC